MPPRLRILICDDSQQHQVLASAALKKALGKDFEVSTEACADGEQALRRMQEGGMDMVLLDYRMPRLDGLAVLRERARLNIEIPVIFVTADDDRETIIEAMKLGATDFLAKHEFSAARLIQVVLAGIERSRLRSDVLRGEKLVAIGTLAGGVAHELNNVLQVVLGQAQNALERNDLARSHAALEAIREAAERGAAIVRQLLSFARTRGSSLVKFRLEDALNDALEADAAVAGHERVEIALSVKPAVLVLGDRGQLALVIQNLLSNARHACKQAQASNRKPRIEVTLDADEDNARLSVRDNGVGMDSAQLKRLFEPFFTTKGSLGGTIFDGKATGTGLGLAMAQRAISAHDGRIDVTSIPGEGSTFTILLPRANELRRTAGKPLQTSTVDKALAGQSVLVLEDEPLIAGLLSAYLGERGMQCDVAFDIEQARELAAKRAYSLLLFDLTLAGGMGGLDLLRELRKGKGPNADRPALAMTGHVESADDEALYLAGFKGVVRKPFSLDDMSRVIAQTLKG